MPRAPAVCRVLFGKENKSSCFCVCGRPCPVDFLACTTLLTEEAFWEEKRDLNAIHITFTFVQAHILRLYRRRHG